MLAAKRGLVDSTAQIDAQSAACTLLHAVRQPPPRFGILLPALAILTDVARGKAGRKHLRVHARIKLSDRQSCVSCGCWGVIRQLSTQGQVGLRLCHLRAALLLAVAEELRFNSPSRPARDNTVSLRRRSRRNARGKNPRLAAAAAASQPSCTETARCARRGTDCRSPDSPQRSY
jgi:hypothetical protein